MKKNTTTMMNADRVKHALAARAEIAKLHNKEEVATAYMNALTMFDLFLDNKSDSLKDWDYLMRPTDAGVKVF